MGIHFLLLQANSSFLHGLALYVSLPTKSLKMISASKNKNTCFKSFFKFIHLLFLREKERKRERAQVDEGQRERGRHRIQSRL